MGLMKALHESLVACHRLWLLI